MPRFVPLKQLRDASNRDVDVFENVAHLQAHRRARALAKAADWIAVSKDTEGAKILLPLALQPLSDPARDGVHADAARCVGALGGALPWSRYAALLKRLATVIDRQAAAVDRFSSKEKKASAAPGAASRKEKPSHQQQRLRTSRTLEATFVSAFCHALDCFSFSEDVVAAAGADDDEDDDADADAMEAPADDDADADAPVEASKETPLSRGVATFLVPTARRLLMRPERRAKTGARDEVLRPPVALSILRLSRKLPRDGREVARQLVVAVCASLRHRDATKRDASRKALARMAAEGASLPLIFTELRAALPAGYMLAVSRCVPFVPSTRRRVAVPRHRRYRRETATDAGTQRRGPLLTREGAAPAPVGNGRRHRVVAGRGFIRRRGGRARRPRGRRAQGGLRRWSLPVSFPAI